MDIEKENDKYLVSLVTNCGATQDEINDLNFNDETGLFESNRLADWFINQINFGWRVWQAAKAQAVLEVKPSRRVTLTCAQLREAFMFGAPDKDDQEQLETEMTIAWSKNGHSGKGYYCYYSDLPEEGAIFLDDVIEAQEQAK